MEIPWQYLRDQFQKLRWLIQNWQFKNSSMQSQNWRREILRIVGVYLRPLC